MIPVMIVEDEFLVRVGLKSLIDWNAYGFYIAADASNGQDGLALYEKYHPYLIITDIRMSPVSGLEMMNQIRELDNEVKFIIISAYNDFEYAQQAIRYGVELYLCKSTFKNDDLTAVLPKIKASYPDTRQTEPSESEPSFQNFSEVFTDASDTGNLEKYLQQHHLSDCPKMVIAARHDRHNHNSINQNLFHNIILNILKRSQISCRLYKKDDFILCLLDASDPEKVHSIARELHKTLLNYTKQACYFGISAPFTRPALRLYRAVNEACLTCNEFIFDKSVYIRDFSGSSTSICYSGQPSGNAANLSNIEIKTERLMSSVFSFRKEESEAIIREIIFSCKNYRSLEKSVFTILLSFIEYDNSSMVSSLMERELKKDDLDGIASSLLEWIYALPFNTMAVSNSNEYVETVISYIKSHLNENLSIQSLAEMIHLSPNYLGKVFYQKTGSFLNNYITGCRMNKACELLRSTDLPVNTIGIMIGISNPHYFSKLFRDTVGCSPSKYRLTPPAS
ncbi:response regulator [uncultured Robinsoniella sp.]|uniref:response regulator n=1 Tax=uncultured Robinsoniella sp. TaxID=904190 RepID=UPI00374F8B35